MQKQSQIEKEDEYNEEDEEVDMNEFVKDIKDMRQRMNLATNKVQEQDQKLVGINDKLYDYNKEVKKGDELMNVVSKGPFSMLKDKIVGIFSSKKENKLDKFDKNDQNVIEQARNRQNIQNNKENNFHFEEKNDWTIIKEGEGQKNKNNQDDILDEALAEVKGMRKDIKNFNNAVKDSTEVVDATNNNFDVALNNVNKVNKKMAKHK